MKLSTKGALAAPSYQLSTSPLLLVTRIHGTPRLMLRVLTRGRITETVTACNAQMLLDYVRNWWPPGTSVQWLVLPQLSTKGRLATVLSTINFLK